MTSFTSKKLPFFSAAQFKESLSESSPAINYVFIGNHIPYANEASPDIISDTVSAEKTVWDNMYAAKRITGNDVEHVIPRINWTGNTKFHQYDDTITISDLISSNSSQNLKPMYVITTGRNVYKCISNNSSANSTVEPTGTYTTSNGNIGTADGFIWKYMYNVTASNKFLTTSWVPAPTSTDALDYGVNSSGVVAGELSNILIVNKGLNYRSVSNVRVNAFTSSQTGLMLANTSLILNLFNIPTLANLTNLSISGTGIASATFITNIENTNGAITLSTATNGIGGNANNIVISTRIYVSGDGTGVVASSALSNVNNTITLANTSLANISNITVTTIGTGYSTANVSIYGSGSGATARVILPPKFGHAFNPAKELNANNIMISVRIGEIDSTENGLISSNTSFRQFGILSNPYKYTSNVEANTTTANSVISQTTDLTIVAGTSYTLDEQVYQGVLSNPSANGFIHAQTTSGVRLTQVRGTFTSGLALIGASSAVSRTVVTVMPVKPEFVKDSGDILYVENAIATTRTDGQAENVNLIISF